MMVFQCLTVVMESGWQMVRMASPMLVALFRAARFSSRFFMNSLNRSEKNQLNWMKHGLFEYFSNFSSVN